MPKFVGISLSLSLVVLSPPANAIPYPYPVAIGTELEVSDGVDVSSLPSVAHDGRGHFVVVWRARTPDGDAVQARHVVSTGLAVDLLAPFVVKAASADTSVSAPSAAMDASGRLTVVWGEARPNAICVRLARYGPAGEAVTSEPPTFCEASAAGTAEAPQVAIAASAAGDVGVVWSRRLAGGQHELLLRRLSPVGTWGPIVTVEPAAGGNPLASVAVGGGQIVVVWQGQSGPGRAFMRRFDLDLRPFAAKKLIASYVPPHTSHPRVAVSQGGQIAAAWHDGTNPAFGVDIRGQIFLPDGTPRAYGRLAPILPDELLNEGLPFRPAIASDRVGGLALVFEWEQGYDAGDIDGTGIRVAIYNHLGDEVADAYFLNTQSQGSQRNPAVTLADDGQFLVAWETPVSSAGAPARQVHAALFRMPHTDDPCIYRGGTFICEFLGSSYSFGVPIAFGNGRQKGDLPLLGDLDGDGRADPCVRRGGEFLCDLAHDGGRAERRIVFGAPGAPAMLGDVDGNGTADPCIRDGRTFLCDTAHDGGSAELSEEFGLTGDIPVLGDVDGDHRADLCVYRPPSATFLCDVRHDGTRGLVYALSTAKPGDRPALGDIDGDGRADVCVVRGNYLLCDLRQGAPRLELRARATRPTDWLLLGGNVDGM